MKKFLSLLLAAMMIFSVLPTAALADGMKTLDMAPVGEVSTPAEEPTQPAEPAQPAEQEQPAAPAEEPAEQPAAEENEAPVLRAPAAAGAAVPAPSATNGFVEEIYFPISIKYSLENHLKRVQGYTFEQNITSYDVVLPEIVGVLGRASTSIGITVPKEYIGGTETLYYRLYFNGKAVGKITKLTTETTRILNQMAQMKAAVPGKWISLTVQVGTLNAAKDDFEYSDVYAFRLTRQASIKSLSVTANGSSLGITPTPDFTNEPYVRDYYIITAEENITLKATVSAGAKIYAGDSEIAGGADVNIDLAQYRIGESSAKIPITVKHDSGEVKSETTYNIYVSSKDYTPVITEQPQNTVTEKDEEKPLTVAASAEGNGTVSYQWYKKGFKIEDATKASYQPSLKYAGTSEYYCIVTNTVDGISYSIKSETVSYEVKLTYLTAPNCYIEKVNGGVFYENGRPSIRVCVANDDYQNDYNDISKDPKKIKIEIYRTDKNESVGGVFVAKANEYKNGESSGYYRWDMIFPPQSVKGTWYYYAVVTVSLEGYEDVVGTSETVQFVFNSIKDVVTMLKGSGSAADPFLVHNQEELEYVKGMVEGKNGEPYDFAGQTIAFANDIFLSADWKPIGAVKEGGKEADRGVSLLPFSGTIDGRDHTLTIADHGKCLFNYVRNAAVENLNIKGSHIDGYALVQRYVVDYGADGTYVSSTAEKHRTIDIENVTVKSGTKILQGGLIGGYASGANNISINNCVIEKGVIIGDDGSYGKIDESEYQYDYVGTLNIRDSIGSFAGSFNGEITNSISYATVYGRNNVGGIVAMKGQSMGKCDFINCAFLGKIIATGDSVGGIAGGGYSGATGTPMVQIHNCYVAADISGNDMVGGIIGAEGGHRENKDEGDAYGVRGVVSITETHFYGTVSAKGSYVGGIVGYFHDFTKKTGEASNFFVSTCGTDRAIGGVAEGNTVVGEERYGLAFSEEDFANGTVNAKLNASESPYKEMLNYAKWIQAAKYPVLDGTAPAVEAKIAAIGTVTKDSGDAIKDARSSYEALTPEQKALVSKEALDTLVKAEKIYDMIIASNKPAASGKEESTGSVIHIAANGASKGEQNPNTGAPAMSIAPAMLVLAAAALVLKKRG